MQLDTITMDRKEARRLFAEYRRDVTAKARVKLGEAERRYRELDDGMLRAYRWLARGYPIIRLSEAVAAGGTELRQVKRSWGDVEQRLPRIAVCRANASHVITSGVQQDGSVRYYAGPLDRWNDPPSTAKPNRVITQPDTFGTEDRPDGHLSRAYCQAMVPTIPPPLRPARGLGGYHILWEAEWGPSVPIDPALLKHAGGDLYAVMAVWNLTELERAVLAQVQA
jgi:hypothetical protein